MIIKYLFLTGILLLNWALFQWILFGLIKLTAREWDDERIHGALSGFTFIMAFINVPLSLELWMMVFN